MASLFSNFDFFNLKKHTLRMVNHAVRFYATRYIIWCARVGLERIVNARRTMAGVYAIVRRRNTGIARRRSVWPG